MDIKVKDRSAKVAKRKGRMPVNGQSMKRMLVDRAAKAQLPVCRDHGAACPNIRTLAEAK